MKRKTERQLLILACDKTIREIILIRDKNTCQFSGKKTNLQVAHIFSRSYLQTRFDESNLVTLNAGIHLYTMHRFPEKFRDWVIARIGQEEFDRLKLRTRVRGTIYTSDLKAVLRYLQIRLDKLKKKVCLQNRI